MAQVGAQVYVRDGGKPNAWVFQLALDHLRDFNADLIGETLMTMRKRSHG